MEIILMEDVPSVGEDGGSGQGSRRLCEKLSLAAQEGRDGDGRGSTDLGTCETSLAAQGGAVRAGAAGTGPAVCGDLLYRRQTAGEGGKLFGAVTSADIEKALREQGVAVDRKKIVLEEPIKNIGPIPFSKAAPRGRGPVETGGREGVASGQGDEGRIRDGFLSSSLPRILRPNNRSWAAS